MSKPQVRKNYVIYIIACALTLMLGLARAQDSKPVSAAKQPKSERETSTRQNTLQTSAAQGSASAGGALKGNEPRSGGQEAKGGAALTVRFTGLRGRKGVLRVALVDRPEAWMSKKTPPLARKDIPLKDMDETTPLDPFVVTFDGLEPGTYALNAYHDANGNNRLDTNFLGIPTERTGASNNPRPAMRAPRFNEAKFDIADGEKKTIAVTLR